MPIADEPPNGFTLLELLVALTVLGFLSVGLAHGMHFGLIAWGTETRLINSNDGFTTLGDTVRHIVEGADPGDDTDPAPFTGNQDRLQCITALPSATTATAARRMQATLLVDEGHRLLLRWRPYVHAVRIGPPSPLTETELLTGVSRIQLAYWRPGSGWLSTWRAPDLPTLVRIRVLFPIGDRRHVPDIVAAPALDRR